MELQHYSTICPFNMLSIYLSPHPPTIYSKLNFQCSYLQQQGLYIKLIIYDVIYLLSSSVMLICTLLITVVTSTVAVTTTNSTQNVSSTSTLPSFTNSTVIVHSSSPGCKLNGSFSLTKSGDSRSIQNEIIIYKWSYPFIYFTIYIVHCDMSYRNFFILWKEILFLNLIQWCSHCSAHTGCHWSGTTTQHELPTTSDELTTTEMNNEPPRR